MTRRPRVMKMTRQASPGAGPRGGHRGGLEAARLGIDHAGLQTSGWRPPASSSTVGEGLDDEAVGRVDADHVEPLVADGGEAVRRRGSDHDDVAGDGNHLFAPDDHGHPAGEHDARLRIRVPMQSRALPRCEVAHEEGDPGRVGLALELDRGDGALPLLATLQDVEQEAPSRDDRGATFGAAAEPA